MRFKQVLITHKKYLLFFILLVFIAVLLDQGLKAYILYLASLKNPIFKSEVIDIVLVFNRGVAFSLGSVLGEYLKWIILLLIVFMVVLVVSNKESFERFFIPFGLIIGSGISNLIDRFVYNGVVDYIYYHYGFKFAIFNLADSLINISVAYIVIVYLCKYFKDRKNI